MAHVSLIKRVRLARASDFADTVYEIGFFKSPAFPISRSHYVGLLLVIDEHAAFA
jgi:hypothetical protein